MLWKVDYFYDKQWQLAQWLDQEDTSEHLPKPNLHQKWAWSLFGGVLVVWFSEFFLNPGKIITSEKYAQHVNEMHWKLQYLQLALVSRKGLILHNNARLHIAQPVLQKLNKLGLIRHIQLTSHQPPLLQASWQLFAGKIASTISRRQKMLSESWLNPQAWIFRYYLLIYFWPCWVFIDVWAFLQLPRARATF